MCLIKIYLTNHTIYLTLIHFNSELYCLSISSSSLLPTICHVQASSRCARPKYALHAPSNKIISCPKLIITEHARTSLEGVAKFTGRLIQSRDQRPASSAKLSINKPLKTEELSLKKENLTIFHVF